MDWIRTLVGLFMAVLLAAFVSPGIAATDKTFTIAPPSSLSVGSQQISVTFTNLGNSSNFNSIELDVDSSSAANLQFDTSKPVTWTSTFSASVSVKSASKLQIVSISPSVKKTITITAWVIATGNGTCGFARAYWDAHAWTGSPSSPSQTFSLSPLYAAPPADPYHSDIQPNCTLSFVNQPADALAGSVITTTPFNNPAGALVKVQLLANGSPPPATSVLVDSASCNIHGSATTDTDGYATFAMLSSAAQASVSGCILTATASGLSANSAPPFKIVMPTGTLGCDFANNTNTKGGNLDPDADQPVGTAPDWGLIRGPNTDGGDCTPIPYTFTLNPDNTASFVADKLGQKVVVEYIVLWYPVPVDASPTSYPGAGIQLTAGWTDRRPTLAWGTGAPGPSDYVPALACVVDNVNAGTAAFPLIPDVDPFHANSHSQYLPNTLASMCVAQHGWTAIGSGNVQYWSKIIDRDGFVRLP